jgi:hypothetical protein
MSDTQASLRLGFIKRIGQFLYLTLAPQALDFSTAGHNRHTGGVITPVLQASQAFQQNSTDIACCNSANNPAHILIPERLSITLVF